MYRVPEDGYYMFTLVVREPGDVHSAGSILVNGVDALCRAEQGTKAGRLDRARYVLECYSFYPVFNPQLFYDVRGPYVRIHVAITNAGRSS